MSAASSEAVALSRRQFMGSWGALVAGVSMGATVPGAESGLGAAELVAEPEAMDPPLSVAMLAAAEGVAGLRFTPEERALMLDGVARQREQYRERRRQVPLPNSAAPGLIFRPIPAGQDLPTQADEIRLAEAAPVPLPGDDASIAFAPVTQLSRWIRDGQLSSERLTRIYLDRLKRFDSLLHCVVTLTDDVALAQARQADRELAAGRYRGPLHGIPWGAKDLVDTKGIATTWGAAPYQDRVAEADAHVVTRLREAGAVLVAKLTLGALAMGDVWFRDVTRNPFRPEQGSSGSSAGSASATAAGLVGFSLGTETLGSIVSPSMRCGTTGLRPTFGRVGRSGAMALCWSLDKIGPITRTVEDSALVLGAINGLDSHDASSVGVGFRYDGREDLAGLKIGYAPQWFEGGNRDMERKALEDLRGLGCELVPIEIPDRAYGSLYTILNVEAAAAFEELTLSGRDDLLVRQQSGAWPNAFRKAWMVPAVEWIQVDRLRRQVMDDMAQLFDRVDLLFGPSFAGRLLVITNFTGHPSLTLRAGFRPDGTPNGVTLWGRLYEEGTLCAVGRRLEERLDVWHRRPGLEA